jgi:hypothetical protein
MQLAFLGLQPLRLRTQTNPLGRIDIQDPQGGELLIHVMAKRDELTDVQCKRALPTFCPKVRDPGRSAADNRPCMIYASR